ncbi:MAG: DUF2760 domain-containing protein [Nitrospirae bacterium]|uniref:DUF2760 domain-containing protein n=1 Tax=Candidatus Magnetobacterium casense TaxID=1455061 RepID=UPI000698BCD5|nr:DUF2760 domain-containing protein [Candidatus Magnetobacterium casensis]MBF0339143.1 DUF2760 domain-containing protein [Nitrospirota bacterium]
MVDLKKVLYVLFGFITGAMGALSLVIPQLNVLGASSRAGVLVGLAVVLSLVLYALIKLIMKGIIKELNEQMLAKKRLEDAARRVKSAVVAETKAVEQPPDPAVIEAMVTERVAKGVAKLAAEKVAQVLSVFQKKGRLIDFLQEDISAFDDNQVGHAVRSIHKECKEAMAEYLSIEPIRKESEGTEVTVESGFDPSAIRITGNVSGQPPFKGILRHCGWTLADARLPEQSENQNPGVIEPAEIEIL